MATTRVAIMAKVEPLVEMPAKLERGMDDYLDAAQVIDLLVHESIDGIALFLIFAHQQVCPGQGVVTLGAKGDYGIALHLLGAYQVAHRCDLMDEIVIRQ